MDVFIRARQCGDLFAWIFGLREPGFCVVGNFMSFMLYETTTLLTKVTI